MSQIPARLLLAEPRLRGALRCTTSPARSLPDNSRKLAGRAAAHTIHRSCVRRIPAPEPSFGSCPCSWHLSAHRCPACRASDVLHARCQRITLCWLDALHIESLVDFDAGRGRLLAVLVNPTCAVAGAAPHHTSITLCAWQAELNSACDTKRQARTQGVAGLLGHVHGRRRHVAEQIPYLADRRCELAFCCLCSQQIESTSQLKAASAHQGSSWAAGTCPWQALEHG